MSVRHFFNKYKYFLTQKSEWKMQEDSLTVGFAAVMGQILISWMVPQSQHLSSMAENSAH